MVSTPDRRLRDRFGKLLAIRGEDPNSSIRSAIGEIFQRIQKRRWKAYVVGGTLRDVMLAPPSAFPRDIDIVVSGATRFDLDAEFADLVVRTTRFGGLHLVKRIVPSGGLTASEVQVLFDVWRLEDTWGIQNAGLSPTIDNFVKTPFLNIDSVAIEVAPKNCRRRLVEHGFFNSISSGLLEINYESNPFPLVCVARSLIMAAKLGFGVGPSLARFVSSFNRWGSIDDLVQAQISHYGRIRCTADELRLWLDDIRQAVAAGAERVEVYTTGERQMQLWSDWPPLSVKHRPSEMFRRIYSTRKPHQAEVQGQLPLLSELDHCR